MNETDLTAARAYMQAGRFEEARTILQGASSLEALRLLQEIDSIVMGDPRQNAAMLELSQAVTAQATLERQAEQSPNAIVTARMGVKSARD